MSHTYYKTYLISVGMIHTWSSMEAAEFVMDSQKCKLDFTNLEVKCITIFNILVRHIQFVLFSDLIQIHWYGCYHQTTWLGFLMRMGGSRQNYNFMFSNIACMFHFLNFNDIQMSYRFQIKPIPLPTDNDTSSQYMHHKGVILHCARTVGG